MRVTPLIALLGSLVLLGGCFDRDNNHPGKNSDPTKPSVQMQQPAQKPAPQPAPDPQPMPQEDQRQ
ncbi:MULTISPECIES: hypothetical protein [unclassified Pseudomonas]|uniref:hypothetical protein n=1 Tax=unclassified Pseudomonas TaxID=196821 RepID=UPI00128F001E|nr:hypothetical protein [Pseudomonas sp. MN1F]MQG94727.1 hypothetical protein [Pseudomonas sp. MN1F]